MSSKVDLKPWTLEALQASGGSAHHLQVARHIWQVHEADLRSSGDLFYTWQYDLRWAAHLLRREGMLCPATSQDDGVWRIADVQ
jgi:hypothetical protein